MYQGRGLWIAMDIAMVGQLFLLNCWKTFPFVKNSLLHLMLRRQERND